MPVKKIEADFEIDISQEFSEIYPGASVGVLVLENLNIQSHVSILEDAKREIILGLQRQFPDQFTLKEHPVIQAYARYYKKFDKTYHVLGQLKSVIFDNRPLPSGSTLVEAIFAAELKNMLLTAFHDLDLIRSPLKIEIASGAEVYTTLRGEEKRLKPADMMVCDQVGVISSVIYGPDKRTCVTASTSKILIVVYAPLGITSGNIISHFEDIENLVSMVTPDYKITMRAVYPNGLKR
jgi:DNA/RNA-binding domain of Phe-tRNA-synthetase-like protein